MEGDWEQGGLWGEVDREELAAALAWMHGAHWAQVCTTLVITLLIRSVALKRESDSSTAGWQPKGHHSNNALPLASVDPETFPHQIGDVILCVPSWVFFLLLDLVWSSSTDVRVSWQNVETTSTHSFWCEGTMVLYFKLATILGVLQLVLERDSLWKIKSTHILLRPPPVCLLRDSTTRSEFKLLTQCSAFISLTGRWSTLLRWALSWCSAHSVRCVLSIIVIPGVVCPHYSRFKGVHTTSCVSPRMHLSSKNLLGAIASENSASRKTWAYKPWNPFDLSGLWIVQCITLPVLRSHVRKP